MKPFVRAARVTICPYWLVITKPDADGNPTVRAVASPAALTVEAPWLLQIIFHVVTHSVLTISAMQQLMII
jgi:hypothetical protein